MYFNGTAPTLSAGDLSQIEQALDLIQSKLPFLLQLMPEQRQFLLKIGDANGRFVDKASEYAADQPEYIPAALSSPADLQERLENYRTMRRLTGLFIPLAQSMEDTTLCLIAKRRLNKCSSADELKGRKRRQRVCAQGLFLCRRLGMNTRTARFGACSWRRMLLALLFIPAGFGKIAGFAGVAGYIASKGVPLPEGARVRIALASGNPLGRVVCVVMTGSRRSP